MNEEQISNAISDYREQERLEFANRESYKKSKIVLENLIASSYVAPIYKLIYKTEYGDFQKFFQIVSKELRSKNPKP